MLNAAKSLPKLDVSSASETLKDQVSRTIKKTKGKKQFEELKEKENGKKSL